MTRNMKDSGVEWIGEIPEDWEVVSLGRIAAIQTGNTPSMQSNEDYYSNGKILWIKPDDLMGLREITDTREKINELGAKIARIVPPLTPLVCCIGSIGKFGYSKFRVAYNQQINAVGFNREKIFWKYGLYFLSTQKEQHWYYSNGNVVQILNSQNQKQLKIALPLYPTQGRIADFLDEKTYLIDTIIEKTKQSIKEYKQYKQSLITETMTKGLTPDVEMKDSGIEWIGEIPRHWEVVKLGHAVWLRDEKGLYESGKDIYIGLENIEAYNGKYIVSPSTYNSTLCNLFKKGDILFNKLRPYLAKCLIPSFDGLCTGELLVISQFSGYKKYLFYNMISPAFIDVLDSSTYGTKMPRVSWEFMRGLTIPFPPLKEQQQIANFLDDKHRTIDLLTEQKRTLIEELESYKKSLIYEYVTGKKQVL